jgi:hypothetical protein
MLRMDSERRIFPRRYFENFRQPPTLIGMTADETLEFERLDCLSSFDHFGNYTWDFERDPKYRKHETGWRLWRAAVGDWAVAVPLKPV